MKFEVGQDRVQVHFVIAYIDAVLGLKRFREILGCPCPEFIIKVFEERYTSLFSADDLNKIFLFVKDKILPKPSDFFQKIETKFGKDYEKSIKVLSKSFDDRAKSYETALNSIKYLSIYLPTLRYFELTALTHLKSLLMERGLKISDEDFFELTATDSYLSLVAKERISLLNIALKFYRSKKDGNYFKDLTVHVDTYSYFELHASTRNPLKYGDFEKRLIDLFGTPKSSLLKEKNELMDRLKAIKARKKELNVKYQFKKNEKELIKIFELISEIKLKITDAVCLINFRIVSASKYFATQWGVKERMFYLLYPHEVRTYSGSKKLPNSLLRSLASRQKAVIWFKNEKANILFQKKAESFLKKYIVEEKTDKNEIFGMPAFMGRVNGRVKIVKNMKEFGKVKKGDILVCSDATPDFAPLFRKVSGIITDEGGVISHAAIVAREMKIPCIVGTKIATKTLKDNDFIELDSKNGVIKKIKKHE